MRRLLVIPCVVLVLFTWMNHRGGLGVFFTRFVDAVYREVRPIPWQTQLCVLLVCVVTAILYARPRRFWAYPLLLAAYAAWALVGRAVAVDMMTGDVEGRWFGAPTDRHALRPPAVDGYTFMCDVRTHPRGWWIDLEYAGAREPIFVGPFIAGRAAETFAGAFSGCVPRSP